MKRAIFLCAILAASTLVVRAQQTGQANPYAGVSTPPANDTITDEAPEQPAPPAAAHPAAKPSPDHYATAPATTPAAPAQQESAPSNRVPPDFITSANGDGTDAGIVEPRQQSPSYGQPAHSPVTTARLYASDPDGDIVHPQPLPPGVLGSGTTILVRLLNDLSSGFNQPGDPFRGTVIQNVFEDGTILIPAGSEIDGRVTQVSTGEGLGSKGSLSLRPETVILPDRTRYQIYAMVSGTPESHTRLGREGEITPGVQVKRDSLWYGGGVGAGAITGAALGGPAGALAGTLVGAAAVTVHLLTSHPQAKLNTGAPVEFTLTEPLRLVPAAASQKGN